MYLLIGDEKALLIDSGYGNLNLAAIIGQLTDKEVICACTHGHGDHALGARQFPRAYLHSADRKVYDIHCGEKGAVALNALEEIKCFELGGRNISWYLFPGHTMGSVVYFDEREKVVYEGDAAPNILWLFLEEALCVEEYSKHLSEYIEWVRKKEIIRRYQGHTIKPGNMSGLIDLKKTCAKILTGKRKGIAVKMPLLNQVYDIHICLNIRMKGIFYKKVFCENVKMV